MIFKGTNSLYLNEATMIEIIQVWADKYLPDPAVVTSVRGPTNTNIDNLYKITVRGKED